MRTFVFLAAAPLLVACASPDPVVHVNQAAEPVVYKAEAPYRSRAQSTYLFCWAYLKTASENVLLNASMQREMKTRLDRLVYAAGDVGYDYHRDPEALAEAVGRVRLALQLSKRENDAIIDNCFELTG